MIPQPILWNLEIHPLDVGHGDSSLVLFYQGNQVQKSILIDGGHGYNKIFLEKKIREKLPVGVLDAVIITHFDLDHWKGIEKLMKIKRKPLIKSGRTIFFTQCSTTFLNKEDKDTESVKDTSQAKSFMELLEKKNFTIHSKHDLVLGESIWNFPLKGVVIEGRPDLKFIAMNQHVLANEETREFVLLQGGHGTKKNQGSISCLISLNDFHHLTSGDICSAQETGIKRYLEAHNVQLAGLKISHHGSYTSSSEDFLKINCFYAIISHGLEHNCPHPKVLAGIFKSPIQTCYLTNKYDARTSLMQLISEEDVNEFLLKTKPKRTKLSKDLSKFANLFSKLKKSDIETWCKENPDSLGCSGDKNEKTDVQSTFESQESFIVNFLQHLDEIELKRGEEEKSEEAKKERDFQVVTKLKKELRKLSETIYLRKYIHFAGKEQERTGQQNGTTIPEKMNKFIRKSESLMEKFSDLMTQIARSLSVWDRFRNKMVIAGDPINKTASHYKNKQPRGNILIQVKSTEDRKTQLTLKYDGQKKKKEKNIEDHYLLLSKAEIEALFKEYINQAQPKSMLKLNNPEIENYKDIFKSDLLNGIPKEECSITFRIKNMENHFNKISLQLQHGFKLYKIKYFYSTNPLDQNRTLIRRINL